MSASSVRLNSTAELAVAPRLQGSWNLRKTEVVIHLRRQKSRHYFTLRANALTGLPKDNNYLVSILT